MGGLTKPSVDNFRSELGLCRAWTRRKSESKGNAGSALCREGFLRRMAKSTKISGQLASIMARKRTPTTLAFGMIELARKDSLDFAD